MKILYVCNEYPPAPHGGIGVFVRIMAHAMVARGHVVTVVGLGSEDRFWDDDGVRVVTIRRMRVRRIAWLVNRWRLHRWITKAADEDRIDLIEIPEYEGMLPFPVRRVPVIVRLHLSETAISQRSGTRPSWTFALCESQTLKHHRHWIGVSEYIQALTSSIFHVEPVTSKVIFNPAVLPALNDFSQSLDLPGDFILFAGTVSERKGAYVLAQAAKEFLRAYPHLHLVYAGRTMRDHGCSARDRICTIVGGDLVPRVHFLGHVSHREVAQCMHRARMFVFPSCLEAFGLVVVEAMFSGLPCVVSNVGPFPEIVRDGETGVMVPPNDAGALSEAVMSLLRHPELASTLARNAAAEVRRRFSLDRCVSETEVFYRDHLGDALV